MARGEKEQKEEEGKTVNKGKKGWLRLRLRMQGRGIKSKRIREWE